MKNFIKGLIMIIMIPVIVGGILFELTKNMFKLGQELLIGIWNNN